MEKSCENAPELRRFVFQRLRLSDIVSLNTQFASKFFDTQRNIGFLLVQKMISTRQASFHIMKSYVRVVRRFWLRFLVPV
jgi:hypothetical protein